MLNKTHISSQFIHHSLGLSLSLSLFPSCFCHALYTLPRSSLGFCIVLLFFCGFCDYFVTLLLCWDLLGFCMLCVVQLISSACVLSYEIQLGSCAIHLALKRSFEPFLDLRHNQHRRGESDQKEYIVWR